MPAEPILKVAALEVMDRCWTTDTALTSPLPHRLLACHLDGSDKMPGKDIATVRSGPQRRRDDSQTEEQRKLQ